MQQGFNRFDHKKKRAAIRIAARHVSRAIRNQNLKSALMYQKRNGRS